MTSIAHNDAVDSPEPPELVIAELACARFGYCHTESGALTDAELAAAGLLVVRRLTLDTLFPDTAKGRAAWKASQE
jgi:hypothetical protein